MTLFDGPMGDDAAGSESGSRDPALADEERSAPAAFVLPEVETGTTPGGLDQVDLAKTDPCPSCGKPVRRMGSVPIAESGLDVRPSGPWHCDECIQTKCSAAYAAVRETHDMPSLD